MKVYHNLYIWRDRKWIWMAQLRYYVDGLRLSHAYQRYKTKIVAEEIGI